MLLIEGDQYHNNGRHCSRIRLQGFEIIFESEVGLSGGWEHLAQMYLADPPDKYVCVYYPLCLGLLGKSAAPASSFAGGLRGGDLYNFSSHLKSNSGQRLFYLKSANIFL
jgi:hypothetical protein